MKKCAASYAILFIISLCFVFTQCRKSGSQPNYSNLWQKLNTPYFGKPLDIKFTSADTGYILGAKYSDDSIYNILIKTNDGGETWKTIAFTDHQFLLNTSNGLMSTIYVSPFNSNIIFSGRNNLIRSDDGGQSWQIVKTNNAINFLMYFFDPLNGISIGWGVSTTTDGGITWNNVLPDWSMDRLQFLGRDTGYGSFGAISTGFVGGFFSTGNIFKTTDGGNTWNPVNYPGYNKENKEGPGVFGLNFINNNTGFIYVIDGGGEDAYSGSEIYKTTDGGNSWATVNSDIIGKFGYVNNFYMQSETEGFFSSEKGIFHTTDGCKTWQKEHEGEIGQMCFPDAHTGYAIDTSGTVYKRVF